MIVLFESSFLMLWVCVSKDCLTLIFSMSTELTKYFLTVRAIFPMVLKNVMCFRTPWTYRARIIMHFVNMFCHFCDQIKYKITPITFPRLDPIFGILKFYFGVFCFSDGYLRLLIGIFCFTFDFFSLLYSFFNFLNRFFSSGVLDFDLIL